MPKKIELARPTALFELKVLEVRPHTGGLVTLRLDPLPVPWQPGDCVDVFNAEGGLSRPYSLCGGVNAPYTELLFRRIDGGSLSSWLASRRPGDVCRVSPPFGWFHPHQPANVPKIYLATGSGIAPFLSALRSGSPDAEAVWWGVRDCADIVFADEIANLRIFVSRGDPGRWEKGRLTGSLKELRLTSRHHLYACGVDAMIEEGLAWASAQGLPAEQLHRECFFTAGPSDT